MEAKASTNGPTQGAGLMSGLGDMEGLGHGNIGNYKGVMLCNRPSEPGELLLNKER